MTISSNPGQDVTVKLALPANNTEAGPGELLLYFSNSERFARAKLKPDVSVGIREFGQESSRSHSRTGDESCVCAFLPHFGAG